MTFSTERSATTISLAIDALFLPSAINRRTSRSRWVSSPRGDVAPRARSATSPSTTFGSITDPPSATARIAATSWSTSCRRSLSRYARPALPASSNARAKSGFAYWLSTTTPSCGFVSRHRAAAWIPSSDWSGGMRMSVTTTSGRSASTAASRDSRSPQTAATSSPSCASSSRRTPSRRR